MVLRLPVCGIPATPQHLIAPKPLRCNALALRQPTGRATRAPAVPVAQGGHDAGARTSALPAGLQASGKGPLSPLSPLGGAQWPWAPQRPLRAGAILRERVRE